MFGEEVTQHAAQRDPIGRRDAQHGDVGVRVVNSGYDLVGRADLGDDFDVGVSRERLPNDVAEQWGHCREDDADRRHATSVEKGAAANHAPAPVGAHQPPGWKEGAGAM